MLQQDEKGQLWQVEMSNLQGQGGVKVTRLEIDPQVTEAQATRISDFHYASARAQDERAVLAAEQARDLEETL